MKPVIIIPFHDQKWHANTRANLARQRNRHDVLMVMNGPAVDTEDFNDLLVCREPFVRSPATALNASVLHARALGYTHAVRFDSDDFYGAGYVDQALGALASGADFVGKRSVFTMLSDGLHLFQREGGQFLGGTFGFDLSKYETAPDVFQDDTAWCDLMASRGRVGVDTGISEFCYVRHGSNAHWKSSDVVLRRAWGGSLYFGKVPASTVEKPNLTEAAWVPPPSDDEVWAAMDEEVFADMPASPSEATGTGAAPCRVAT